MIDIKFQTADKMTLKILQAAMLLAQTGGVEKKIIKLVIDDLDIGIAELATHKG